MPTHPGCTIVLNGSVYTLTAYVGRRGSIATWLASDSRDETVSVNLPVAA